MTVYVVQGRLVKFKLESVRTGDQDYHPTCSNLQARPGYQLRTFDLNAHRGQTVNLCFRAREDNGSMTSFVLHDFAISVE